MINISVVTPSVRPLMLPIIAKCLKRQTFTDWEWIIASPQSMFVEIDRQIGHDIDFVFVAEPPKLEEDFYGLNKAWNVAYARARGELVVNIQDGIYVPPDLLERFWGHYVNLPSALVTAVGDQYDQIDERGKPTNMVWQDPRDRSKFAEVASSEMEMAVCSVPKQAILDSGGLDEKWDQFAALSEKELCCRLVKLGYKLYLDPTLEYRAIHHERLKGKETWDKAYWAGAEYFKKCVHEIEEGTRPLNINCLKMV